MNRYHQHEFSEAAEETAPTEAWLFAQALLGKPIPKIVSPEARARTKREELERLAQYSPNHAEQLRRLRRAEDDARNEQELLEFAVKISPRAEATLAALVREETAEREAWRRAEEFAKRLLESEAKERRSIGTCNRSSVEPITEWDPNQRRQPKGTHQGGQWAPNGGGASSGSSLLDKVVQRNREVAGLSGVNTPGMQQSSRLATELQSAAKLPGEVIRAAAAGLGTGGKAVVNGSATAIKNTVTLGLSPGQLELIGVTKEDRARGYDSAVAIATASGEVLIAVGTGGLTSALSKGGTIARTASGVLVAYDAAGNAVGVVQGTYDAAQNGLTLSNAAQIAGGLAGLGANAAAIRELHSLSAARRAAEIDKYVEGLPRTRTPTKSAANKYEIKHTGPYNYTVTGGGESFAIDGYRGTTILDAKHAGKLDKSPFVPGSSCPAPVRKKILDEVREELRRARVIIESGESPFTSVEIITNSRESQTLFQDMLKESRLTGTVRFEP